jgi:pilus assembly protein TadC
MILPLFIALGAGAIVFLLGLWRYQHDAAASQDAQRAIDKKRIEALPQVDPASAEYRLAAAGLRSDHPQVMWIILHYVPPILAFIAVLLIGFPFAVGVAAAALGYLIPRLWIEGQIKGRGRRIDQELPMTYVRLSSILRANPEVAQALIETANSIEIERGGSVTPLSGELRLTASEMLTKTIGREAALQRLQRRAPSTSLSNLGLLLERLSQTAAGAGNSRFFAAFESAAQNVQAIIEARETARSKASMAMRSAQMIPLMLIIMTVSLMNSPTTRESFASPIVQIVMALAVVLMFIGYTFMSDMVRDAV